MLSKFPVRRVLTQVRKFSSCGSMMTAAGPVPLTNKLEIVNTADLPKIPIFQIMDQKGKLIEGAIEPKLTEAEAAKMMQYMIRIHYLDDILYNAQRQGRISFYMQAAGEEGIHIGK